MPKPAARYARERLPDDPHLPIRWVAGVDEAGRGPLAGPVVAAAVILAEGYLNPAIRDSKQVPEAERAELAAVIRSEALAWAVAEATVEEIDRHNILGATFLAMSRALEQLTPVPDLALIDGNRFWLQSPVPFRCEVKGDARFPEIAAASILAKAHRDACMCRLHELYPQYGWAVNKGYPTAGHRAALAAHGATPHHRRSFRLLAGSGEGLFEHLGDHDEQLVGVNR
jgi:ribonuclease HII